MTPRSRKAVEPPPAAHGLSTPLRLALFLAGVFILKLIVVWQLKDHLLLQPDTGLDTTAYVNLAKQVLAGNLGLGPGLYYVSPLYIYVLAAAYGLASSFTAVRILQIALGTVSVGLIFLTAREWFGTRAAWLAAGLAALTGLFTFYEALIIQAAIDPLLTAVALWLLTLALRRGERRWFLLAGLAFGIQSLNRPNVLLAAAAIAAALLLARRPKPAVWIAAGLVIGLAPVGVRNAVVSHQWSLLSSHGGLNFYMGNSATATGWFHILPGIRPSIEGQEVDARNVAERAVGRKLSDAEVSSYFSGLAWAWIREHPGDALWLFIRKVGDVFNAQHISLPFSYPFYAYDARTPLRFLFVGLWLLVPVGLFGLVRAAPADRRVEYLIWLSFVPAYTIAVALFFISERYRLPLFVPLSIGAGAGLDALIAMTRARRLPALALSGGAIAVLMVASNWPLGLDDGRAEERIRMAERLAFAGKVEESEQWTSLVLATRPFPKTVHYRVGTQFINSGQLGPAIAHLTTALELEPGSSRVEYALGQALVHAGRQQEGIPHLRRAVDAGLDIDLIGYDLAAALEEAGDFEDAARALRSVTPGPGADVEVWLRLGRLAAEVKAPELAERFFKHAVEMAPALPSARQQYGLDLLVLRRYEDAARELAAAVQLDPQDANSLAHLSASELQLGRISEARTHADAALRIDPKHGVALQIQAAIARIK